MDVIGNSNMLAEADVCLSAVKQIRVNLRQAGAGQDAYH